ncbi:PilX N-terminal domain-containing pilus assembly protein [Simiduia sp. 21SJ11W-1]|uniref:pilus assembly PilX family protein n=1 Tax=Simiduia sp. 21SJ11W-1 TaxID=2909669 RepID=UPI00209C8BA8|nr:PilX N-terminal domain-containing pilus assembly protein [Simiduia sp. 21SJ11W-1]UTA47333.1 PilX N-terminal domain-containing pilus assembly protein [Simiduia sp. 21SJ11W-1]
MKHSINNQRGAVLAISLVVLLVLTILVLSNNQQVVLQERMTASVRDSHLSREAAEYALLDAEAKIDAFTNTSGFKDDGAGGLYSKDNGPVDLFNGSNWAAGKIFTGSMTVSGQTVNYSYYIEELGIIPVADDELSSINITGYGQTTGGGDVTAFKVVARALGMSGSAERLVVAYYGKRL